MTHETPDFSAESGEKDKLAETAPDLGAVATGYEADHQRALAENVRRDLEKQGYGFLTNEPTKSSHGSHSVLPRFQSFQG